METELSGAHLRSYRKIFCHPISHNLGWRETRALLKRLGTVVEEPNGCLRFGRNGNVLVIRGHQPGETVDVERLMELRHFLEGSEAPLADAAEKEAHWLVVINHHEARVFRSVMHGSVPSRIMPHKPEDHFRHAHNSKDFARGRERPDPNSFFGPVAEVLGRNGAILVVGSGKGTGSEMGEFTKWLDSKHPEISRRVIGSIVVDQHHLTEAQLLRTAQEFYAGELAQGKG